ncbi:dirigent-like protein [Kutzneria buriramensis]|uniref:Dirigent-like protein n=1 Tax=Kutzneria buriramensis TaxID=1045776 RepID=A0A3E0I9B6_9PSEU|nr:dirigent-like protein [Kutzneria buriramensis]
MLAAPAMAAGGLVVVGASTVSATPADALTFVASRATSSSLDKAVVGTTFGSLLTLFDSTSAAAGDGSMIGTVVNVTVDSPPKLVVQMKIVLRLSAAFKGELHLSSMHAMVVPSPAQNPIAIVGGTGQYANARGEGTITYPTPDRINFTLNVAN